MNLPSFRNSSIKTKLMLSMAACLLVFLVVSSSLSVTLSSRGLRARVVDEELPARIGQIRNDILRQIAVPLTASLAIADNTYLHAWENAGLPEDGVPAWLTYANAVKQKNKAETVFWVSSSTGKYYTDKGFNLIMT